MWGKAGPTPGFIESRDHRFPSHSDLDESNVWTSRSC